ncbi:MAG TPA: response regulator [Azospirillaceae bacterium]|nr:response regulator [Azospirillaceae bacterium]HRQ82021.1 response regulator [Azospirillaceae bacterium]
MAEPTKPLRLLVADDESATRMMSRALLERRGHIVSEAADGRQAAHAVATAEPPFDAVLLDLHMPVCDGLEALELIRADADPARAGVAVIMLTAISDPAVERTLLDEGADAVLVKPLRWENLAPALAAAVSAADGEANPPVTAPPLSPIERLAADLAPEKVRRLLDIAYANIAQHQTDLTAAADQGDAMEISRLAHKIAGVAGTYGCDALRAAAAALEREAETADHPALTARVADMAPIFTAALATLRDWPKRAS